MIVETNGVLELELQIKKQVHSLKDEVIKLRRDFHQHPELGLEEFRTAEKIEAYLKSLGIEVNRIAGTGVIGLLKGGLNEQTILLRADIDALPMEEKTSVSYKSKRRGKMHSCGHDGHTAMHPQPA